MGAKNILTVIKHVIIIFVCIALALLAAYKVIDMFMAEKEFKETSSSLSYHLITKQQSDLANKGDGNIRVKLIVKDAVLKIAGKEHVVLTSDDKRVIKLEDGKLPNRTTVHGDFKLRGVHIPSDNYRLAYIDEHGNIFYSNKFYFKAGKTNKGTVVIPVDDEDIYKPEAIEFLPGENAKLNKNGIITLNSEKSLKDNDEKVPEVVPDKGYEFSGKWQTTEDVKINGKKFPRGSFISSKDLENVKISRLTLMKAEIKKKDSKDTKNEDKNKDKDKDKDKNNEDKNK